MAGSKDLERARTWLRGNELGDIEPTPLIIERLAAVRRSYRYGEFTGFLLFFSALAASPDVDWRPWGDAGLEATDIHKLVMAIALTVAMLFGSGLGMWLRRRAVRSMGRLPTRTAHATAPGVVSLLGRRCAVVVALMYTGGLLLGVSVAVFADRPRDRAFAYVFLASVLMLAVLGAVVLRSVLRRPAFADDAASLVVDDLVRAQDARLATAPFPLAFALASIFGTFGSWVFWANLGYFAVIGVTYALVTDWSPAAPKAEVVR